MKARHGFTLLEVLVAAAISALLAALMLGVLAQVLGSWGRLSGQLSAATQAGTILDQLEADLEAVFLRADDQVWLAATVQRDQSGSGDAGMSGVDWAADSKPRGAASLRLVPPDGRPESRRFGQAGVWLRFFTTQPDSNASASNRSAPRAVAYQLVRRRVGARFAYQLYRSQVRPGDGASTFAEGYDLFSSGYTTPNGAAQHPGNVRRPNATFLIGNHVIDFGVRIFVREPDGSERPAFPVTNVPDQSFVATTAAAAAPPGYASAPVVRGFPSSVEVFVRLLDDETAQRLWNLETGRVPPPPGLTRDEAWWHLVETRGHTAVRRVAVRAARP
jgi:prepilin-type N-terminal cleavage/methylation domain-containing protein